MSRRYYVDAPLFPGELELEGPEAHHLLHVMRAGPGEKIILFCGDGTESEAEIVAANKRSVLLRVETAVVVSRELSAYIHIATAFPKGDRADFLIEKLTELGVAELTPLNTERSVNRVREDKLEKLRRQVIEASKQCGRNKLMAVNRPMDLKEFLQQPREGEKWLPHPGGGAADILNYAQYPNTFCIGPEGGFSDTEVEYARESNWNLISFGQRVLRTETACIAAALYFPIR